MRKLTLLSALLSSAAPCPCHLRALNFHHTLISRDVPSQRLLAVVQEEPVFSNWHARARDAHLIVLSTHRLHKNIMSEFQLMEEFLNGFVDIATPTMAARSVVAFVPFLSGAMETCGNDGVNPGQRRQENFMRLHATLVEAMTTASDELAAGHRDQQLGLQKTGCTPVQLYSRASAM